jgi:hypothetical protein
MNGRRVAIAVAGSLAVLIAGSSIGVRVWTQTHPCEVPNLPIPDWRSLSCHPETALHYPGSVLVTTGGSQEESRGFEQPQAATFDAYWGLNGGDQAQVEAWFGDQVSNLGWTSQPPVAAASLVWNRGREHFVLFLLGPNDYMVQSRADLRAFSLPYQTRYWIDPFGPTIWFRLAAGDLART